MQFVCTDELRPGMRLAKPIYNKNGVLLYERNSRITIPGINSVRNFGLIGLYILEPAEPVPPLSKEDLEFEQAQTIYLFRLKDTFEKIHKRDNLDKLPELVQDIASRYGSLKHRVNFNQNLRSPDDFIYKHAISTAIVTAIISNHIDLTEQEQESLIAAALLFDFGYRYVPRPIMEKGTALTDFDKSIIQNSLEKGLNYLRTYHSNIPFLPMALATTEYYILSKNPERTVKCPSEKVFLLAEILKIAEQFDFLTGMNIGYEPESEIMAMKTLQAHPTEYNATIVSILAQCIHIIPAGASVDLSTRDKGIVLVENPVNYMEPVVLRLSDNNVYDLSDPDISRRLHIVDLAKTMDNRIEIDENTLKQFVADKRIIEMTQKFKRRSNTTS